MTTKEPGLDMTDEDLDLAELIRAAGARTRPAAGAAAEVRSALESEWRGLVAGRRRRRTFAGWAAAAGVGVAALALWTARPLYLPTGDPFATLARVEGQVEYRGASDPGWISVTSSLNLKSGDALRTVGIGRVALTLASGLDVRLDSGTQLAFVDSSHVALDHGAVYVDSGAAGDARRRDLQVATPLGDISHLGTQYEVRLDDGSLRVAVREGRVKVGIKGTTVLANAGELIRVADSGVSRTVLPRSSDQWSWVGAITPPFPIEGKSVAEFLTWAGRETGRSIDYASPEVSRQAHGIVLRGSVAGLTPDQAVSAVLSTTPLRPEVLEDRIYIEGSTL
jgi:ferric-dicitrate binding protein FerR (iron transport regulator)